MSERKDKKIAWVIFNLKLKHLEKMKDYLDELKTTDP